MVCNIKADLENKVLGLIFGPKRGEITGDGRQLHNENHHDSYRSYQINMTDVGEKYCPSWEKKSACSVLGGKPEGKRPLGTQSVDGSMMLVRVLELCEEGTLKWLHLSQRRVWRSAVNTVMNLRILWHVGNFLADWGTISFSWALLHELVADFNS